MSLTQDTHVQVDTTHGKVWTKAWTTSVDGLVIVHDVDHDRWNLTHRSSGKAVMQLQSGMVNALRVAAHRLRDHDWTQAEGDMTQEQINAMAKAVDAVMKAGVADAMKVAMDLAEETAPDVTPATERGASTV